MKYKFHVNNQYSAFYGDKVETEIETIPNFMKFGDLVELELHFLVNNGSTYSFIDDKGYYCISYSENYII